MNGRELLDRMSSYQLSKQTTELDSCNTDSQRNVRVRTLTSKMTSSLSPPADRIIMGLYIYIYIYIYIYKGLPT